MIKGDICMLYLHDLSAMLGRLFSVSLRRIIYLKIGFLIFRFDLDIKCHRLCVKLLKRVALLKDLRIPGDILFPNGKAFFFA